MPATPRRRLTALDLLPGQEFIDALDAAWDRGDAVLPIDPGAPTSEVRRLTQAMQLDEPVDDDIALVIATSGSTGEPKGAQLSSAALSASAEATRVFLDAKPDDVWLSCLPWHHIGGLQVMLRARQWDVPLIVHARFDIDEFERAEATLVSLVPTQLARLLDAAVDLTPFRAILLGAAAAPAELLDRARVVGANVITTYGMSETCGGCVYDGKALPGVDVGITDEGRIAISGPMLMSGYRSRPELTAEALVDGRLITKDLGEIDDKGRLRVLGRADDVIISGGENVAAQWVSDVLRSHPAVRDAAVVGVPDEEWGQRVVALIVPTGTTVSVDELRRWSAGKLPAAAMPRAVVAVEEIPLLPSGKPDRLRLRRLAAEAD